MSFRSLSMGSLAIDIQIDRNKEAQALTRIIGLPDAAVRKSKDRVFLAIKNSGFNIENPSCTILLAPADLKKVGAFYDLPIALGLLHCLGKCLSSTLENYLI